MPTKPTQLRIPPALLDQIDKAAEKEDLTRTSWLLKAAQAQLGIASEPQPSANGSVLRADAPAEHYRCPVHPDFEVRSSSAQCWCNRKVIRA